MSHDFIDSTVNNSNNNTGGALDAEMIVIQKHHIIPRYRCKEIGIDPDFPENIIYISRHAHIMEHWRRFMIHGDPRDLGGAQFLARGEIEGLPVLRGKDHPRYGVKASAETKKKISETKTGVKHSDETRKKMSLAKKGRKMSAEQKKKISETMTGRTLSDEHKRKISENNGMKRHKNNQ